MVCVKLFPFLLPFLVQMFCPFAIGLRPFRYLHIAPTSFVVSIGADTVRAHWVVVTRPRSWALLLRRPCRPHLMGSPGRPPS